MAEHSQNNLVWILRIEHAHAELLGQIRHWSNVKIASKDGIYWLKDFTKSQIESVELKSIPFKSLYYLQEEKLFPAGSNLPEMKMPSALLWSPIEAGIKVTLPAYNFNFFGIQEKLQIQLLPLEAEQPAFAMLVTLKVLQSYMETAPAIRFNHLSWVILQNDSALILGTPLLPLSGKTFWRREDMLLPSGYDLSTFSLSKSLNVAIDGARGNWILWSEGGYSLIPKEKVKPLSISSIRKTRELIASTS